MPYRRKNQVSTCLSLPPGEPIHGRPPRLHSTHKGILALHRTEIPSHPFRNTGKKHQS
jgi:hypothetical protein